MKSAAASPVVNALSFDIEDWFHMVGIDAVDKPELWPTFPSLAERYTDQILQALADANVRATFFTLGWIADRHPALVRRIADAGHELGTHSYWHRQCFTLTPEELREDLRRSIDAIENAGGQKLLGFRAPTFSIIPGSEWVFDVLLDLGLKYDASLFPGVHGGGGYPCPMERHYFTGAPSGRPMPELPMSMMTLLGRRIAFSGGGYLRLLPPWLIRRGFDQLNAQGIPVVAYLHPRDFAADCPRVPMPPHRKFKCYVGLGSTAAKFKMLLERYRFTTCAEVAGIVQ
ncbi:polysaccharide deacetylase family protein [Lacipirellula parvula]|uniref:Polysaccharide deacetylase n=1 Tax=Lacipirellula parvula TaxID=2650471 RepID=A0A5K7X4P6_9BACT|nr:polysaccharide deacetylase family protein [Lacipirellula parvula]BBO31365.1 polysaccharide deacetylase [Lacipirellula parvula]